jgi:hypothetical protein
VLHWHVHGAWSTAFVQGDHDHLVPVVPGRGPDGRGRARTYEWPRRVRELSPAQLRDEPVDVLVLQRPRDVVLARAWLGDRRIPTVYVEHDCPRGDVPHTRHLMADRSDVPLVHVTHFNALMWDSGAAPVQVIEHGVVDPGPLWTGELPRIAAVVNDPARRGRLVGADLLRYFAGVGPLDLFGMNADRIPGVVAADLPQAELHRQLARRRAYVHPFRWTSLGLSLIEAMHLGMPVVTLATTEAAEFVPPAAGACSNRMDVLAGALRRFLADPAEAAAAGRVARAAVLARYGLARFLHDWDRLLKEVTR